MKRWRYAAFSLYLAASCSDETGTEDDTSRETDSGSSSNTSTASSTLEGSSATETTTSTSSTGEAESSNEGQETPASTDDDSTTEDSGSEADPTGESSNSDAAEETTATPIEPDAELGDCPGLDDVEHSEKFEYTMIYSGSSAFLDTGEPPTGTIRDASEYEKFRASVHAGAIVWPDVDFSTQRVIYASATVLSSCLVRVAEHHVVELNGTVFLDVRAEDISGTCMRKCDETYVGMVIILVERTSALAACARRYDICEQ